jgi:hypothetical protein
MTTADSPQFISEIALKANPHAGGRRNSLAERPFAGAATECSVKTTLPEPAAASHHGQSFEGTGAYGCRRAAKLLLQGVATPNNPPQTSAVPGEEAAVAGQRKLPVLY